MDSLIDIHILIPEFIAIYVTLNFVSQFQKWELVYPIIDIINPLDVAETFTLVVCQIEYIKLYFHIHKHFINSYLSYRKSICYINTQCLEMPLVQYCLTLKKYSSI